MTWQQRIKSPRIFDVSFGQNFFDVDATNQPLTELPPTASPSAASKSAVKRRIFFDAARVVFRFDVGGGCNSLSWIWSWVTLFATNCGEWIALPHQWWMIWWKWYLQIIHQRGDVLCRDVIISTIRICLPPGAGPIRRNKNPNPYQWWLQNIYMLSPDCEKKLSCHIVMYSPSILHTIVGKLKYFPY